MAQVQLPGDLGHLDFTDWVRGIVAAFISGGASAVVSGLTVIATDPGGDYNLHTGRFYTLVGTLFIVNGTLGAALFLRNKPIPDVKTTTRERETRETRIQPAVTIVTKEKEVTTEPAKPNDKGDK